MISLMDYVTPDGVSDCKAGFDAALTALAATSSRTLLVPAGVYRFLSPPAPITCALNLVGEGKAVSWLIRDYTGLGNYLLKIVGGQDWYGGGSIRDLSFGAGPGSSGGICVYILPHSETDPTVLSKNPHGLLIDNTQIGRFTTDGGTWAFGIYLDGSQNPGTNGAAPGARAIAIRNTSVSGHTTAPVYLYNAYGTRMTDVDAYIGPTVIGQTGSANTILRSGTCTLG